MCETDISLGRWRYLVLTLLEDTYHPQVNCITLEILDKHYPFVLLQFYLLLLLSIRIALWQQNRLPLLERNINLATVTYNNVLDLPLLDIEQYWISEMTQRLDAISMLIYASKVSDVRWINKQW